MKKKIPFSLDYKEKIESGEVSVVTIEDKPVEYIGYDGSNNLYFRYKGLIFKHSELQLYLRIEEDGELTEFEKDLLSVITTRHEYAGTTEKYVKEWAEVLLGDAKRQLESESGCCTSDSLRYAMRYYNKGKKDALNDMPKWERAAEDLQIGCLVWDERRNFHLYMDRVSKGELYISMADILRLPGSPKEREE